MEEIKVSVLVATYNQRDYIKDCLNGILSQKTTFGFEVLVNDDCSTDGTTEILQEYEKKYPNLVKPVYQEENQYSKGTVRMLDDLLVPLAQGKYIAICEGDDYWINDNKLQMQYDYMEANPDCTFCFTDAYIYDCTINKMLPFFKQFNQPKQDEDKILVENERITLAEMLRVSFIPTASYFYPIKNYEKFPNEYYKNIVAGDRQKTLFSIALGYGHYIKEKTCVYRFRAKGSVMAQMLQYSPEKIFNQNVIMLEFYEDVNKTTGYKYDKEIYEATKPIKLDMILSGYDKTLINNTEYRKIYKEAPLKMRLKIFLNYKNPKLLQKLLCFKRRVVKFIKNARSK